MHEYIYTVHLFTLIATTSTICCRTKTNSQLCEEITSVLMCGQVSPSGYTGGRKLAYSTYASSESGYKTIVGLCGSPLQHTPTSSLCLQSCRPHPLMWQSRKVVSVPLQSKLFNHIGRLAPPHCSPHVYMLWAPVYPSCRQMTLAIIMSAWSSQMVP